ncbi:oxidoreductase family [Thraustotheca clavata]|uniref:Oxidoreductase family n=1 Tax=Thraustotheca clavata TaxID=74557 RepID=A0A1W0A6U0_9STRA|nr:oxidoreductase family [Thraustotheca clavata]
MYYTKQATSYNGVDISFNNVVASKDAVKLVTELKEAPDNFPVLLAGLVAIQRMIDGKDNESTAKSLGTAGACEVVTSIMKANTPHEEVQFYGSQAVRSLAKSSRNIHRFEAVNIIDHLHELLLEFASTPRVVCELLWAIEILVTTSEPLTLRFFQRLNGVPLLLSLLSRYLDDLLIQIHGVRILGVVGRRFKKFIQEYIEDCGHHVLTTIVTHALSIDLVIACVVFIELVCDQHVTLFFDNSAWFRTTFVSHVTHENVVLEFLHLYQTLCHASSEHAITLAHEGGWYCIEKALEQYHGKDTTAFEFLRLIHQLVSRLKNCSFLPSPRLLELVLKCHQQYPNHCLLQIEVKKKPRCLRCTNETRIIATHWCMGRYSKFPSSLRSFVYTSSIMAAQFASSLMHSSKLSMLGRAVTGSSNLLPLRQIWSKMTANGRALVVVVGAGRMGQIRVQGIMAHPRFKVAYVVDENLKQAQDLADRCDATAVATLQEALCDPEITSVWISTPTFTHLDLIEMAAVAGKAIAVEKPVAGSLEDLDKAYAICQKYDVPLFCSFQRRFDPNYAALYDAVEGNAIGQVQSIQTVFRDHPTPAVEFLKGGGDPFHDLAVHDIDFVCYMQHEYPTRVIAYGTSLHPELQVINVMDKASVWLEFPSGVVCTMDLSRHAAYGYDQRIEVFGADGMLEVQNIQKTSLRASTRAGVMSDVYQHSFPQRFREAYLAEIDHFSTVVLEKAAPKVTWEASRNATIIAEACRISAVEHRPV